VLVAWLATGLAGSLGFLLVGDLPSATAAAVTRIARSGTQKTLAPVPSLAPLAPEQHQAFMKRILPMLGSGYTQREIAKRLGVPGVAGKRLDSGRNVRAPERFRSELDTHVTGDFYGFYGSQNEPSIAVSQIDSNVVLAFTHNNLNISGVSNACTIYLSFNGGQDFFYSSDAPLEATDRDGDGTGDIHFCSDPVVRTSPYPVFTTTSHVFYLTYMDINNGDSNDATVVQTSKIRLHRLLAWDPSATFTTNVLDVGLTGFSDKNWVDVHTFDAADGSLDAFGNVYVTSTAFFNDGSCGILFNRSTDFGATWNFGTGALLVYTGAGATCANPFLVQGSRPIGGPGSKALVCFYDSASDGWSPGSSSTTSNKFFIDCAASADEFNTFTFVAPTPPIAYEAPFWLGPNQSLHRWWGSMFPAVAIDHLGNGHLAYTADPTSNKNDAESGNVYYQKSTLNATTNTLYQVWSGKSALGSGSMAQGWASVVAQRVNTQKSPIIYLAYLDHQRSTALGPGLQNVSYDAKYRRSIIGGPTFQTPVFASDQSSLSEYLFIGDYIDGAANSRRYHVIWTDRADKTSIFDYEDDIFTDRF
jgi:hypothetical protein